MVMTDIKTKLRPFTFDDAQACIDLFNACSQHLYGVDDSDLEDLMSDWTSPGINANEMIRVVESQTGEVIGYIDVWDNTTPHVVKWVWGILHPNYWDDGLYFQMTSWAESLARETLKATLEHIRVDNEDLHVYVFPTNNEFVKEEMRGVSGRSVWKNTVSLAIHAGANWEEQLRETLAHEYAHAVMHRYHEFFGSVQNMLVFEGIAEPFKEAKVNEEHSPWVEAVPVDTARRLYNELTGDESYQELFYGTGDLPRWAGYSIGYNLVKVEVDGNVDWKTIFTTPPKVVAKQF